MSDYITNKKDMKFKSQDALKAVQAVIDEADMAIQDKSRKIEQEALAKKFSILGAGVGMIAGAVPVAAVPVAAELAAAGGLISGGMLAGIAVLAAPAVLLGGAGIGIVSYNKNKKLREAKELIYKNALAKQIAIIKALKEENNNDKKRIDYLNGLNILLQSVIKDLQHDLGIAA